jgi:hypothetical protein
MILDSRNADALRRMMINGSSIKGRLEAFTAFTLPGTMEVLASVVHGNNAEALRQEVKLKGILETTTNREDVPWRIDPQAGYGDNALARQRVAASRSRKMDVAVKLQPLPTEPYGRERCDRYVSLALLSKFRPSFPR